MTKQISRAIFVFLFFVFTSLPGNGRIVFSDLDLSAGNQLLFRAAAESAGTRDALFMALLTGSPSGQGHALQQLTAYPEKMDLLEKGLVLQIRNSFGALRIPVSGGLPMPVPGLPSFAGGNVMASGRPEEMASSADGRWLLYLDPVSPALGNLVMLDVYSGAKMQIASNLERPEKSFPALWSPDSRFFIYERAGKLYYYMTGSSFMPGDERTRLIGEGTVNSISWSRSGDFYYLRGSTLFRVRGTELFTRTIYADFLEIGTVAGRIPFEFDPYFDRFWIAPDARSLLVSKGRRSVFYYPLSMDESRGASETVLPYLALPRSCSGINVLWSPAGTVTILVSIPNNAGTAANIWRLNLAGAGGAVFEPLPPPAPGNKPGSFPAGSISPDGDLALFWGAGGILLYDYINWKLLDVLGALPAAACLWAGDREIITGDEQKIERIRLKPDTPAVSGRELVCLSGAHQFAFEDKSSRILAKNGDAWFVTSGRSPWTLINTPPVRTASQVSAQYRVYLERQGAGYYANLPMIRNVASVGTFPLFPASPSASPSGYSNEPFARPREAALCFDLYDDDQGLPEVLDALNRFGIKASFFLNGEFIRRRPLAVTEIVSAGHEAASMFFALIDLSDARYRAGPDFITRGLARNEDEFYLVTGKELALLWHPPWYTLSPDVEAAAARAGYTTSGRDIDPLDWVSREDEKKLGLNQRSPSEMIDRIMKELKPGSVIPIRLGFLPGGRSDYLFNRINVLLDALVREGYTLTTVSNLVRQ